MKPLNYVHEAVLKKRKANEEWVLKKRERVDARKRRYIENKKFAIKRPEQFVKEYRDKVKILIVNCQMIHGSAFSFC